MKPTAKIYLLILMSTASGLLPSKGSGEMAVKAAQGKVSDLPERPNILLLVVDDLNAEVGFLDDPHAMTPNMDRLASQSAVFVNAHVQAPICGPSRNSFLTGKYPHNTGLYGLDGLSLTDLIEGRPGAEQRPPALTSHGPGNFSLRDERWRYTRYADGSEELYDHTNDSEERRNLATNAEYKDAIARLKPFVPEESKPFAPGSKGMGSPQFPGK